MVVVAAFGCGSKSEQAAPTAAVTTITEAEYAAKLIPLLEKRRPGLRLHYDPATREITDRGGELAYHFAVGNVYREYLSVPAAQQADALEHVARSMSTMSSGARDLPLTDARARLRPVVRAGLYFEIDLQLGKATTDDGTLSEPLGDATAIGIGVDSPDSISLATVKQLASWKLSFAEAKDIAIANLRAMNLGFEKVAPGVWASAAHDNYDSSRLLLVDEINALGLAPPVVAMIPNRDALFLASGKDAKALLAMADLAETAAVEPRPIHTVALCLVNKLWTECEPEITPAVKARYHALAARGWGELYTEQHGPLQKLVGEDVFVAKLTVLQDPETRRIVTYAALTHTVPTLLPRAEVVALMQIDTNEKARMLGIVSWERLMAVAGDRVKRDKRSPPRWSTGDYFPTAAEIAKLAPADNPFSALAR